MTWRPGDVVVYRLIRYGKIRYALPHVVVQDSEDLVALYVPVGAVGKAPSNDGRPARGQADRDWELRDHVWHSNGMLRLLRPGEPYGLELHWRDEDAAFIGWYVNLQEPIRRTNRGFDTDDLVLDIVIEPDGAWTWKDEDELAEVVALGRFDADEAAEIRQFGERVIEQLDRLIPTGWEGWRPDPSWPTPALGAGWDEL